MHGKISLPFFEIGPKAYLYGQELLDLAKAADEASVKYNVDVIFTIPHTEISRIASSVKKLLIFAQHMDWQEPGRGMGLVIAEALKSAGAVGVMLNHAEHPMAMCDLSKSIKRARETGLYSIVCTDTIEEAAAVAYLAPDIIVAEPTSNIGTGKTSDMTYVLKTIETIRSIDSRIKVLQGAGIKSGSDVYDMIFAGADATGSTSGILKAPDPLAMVDEMLRAARQAWDDRNSGDMLKK